jgi:hypothetical protein
MQIVTIGVLRWNDDAKRRDALRFPAYICHSKETDVELSEKKNHGT